MRRIDRAGLRRRAVIQTRIEPCFSRYDDLDPEAVAWICAQFKRGNEWAWCDVCVTANVRELSGSDWLSECSYASEEDFKREGGYYDQMVTEALEDLAHQIESIEEEHDIWEHDRVTCFQCVARNVA